MKRQLSEDTTKKKGKSSSEETHISNIETHISNIAE